MEKACFTPQPLTSVRVHTLYNFMPSYVYLEHEFMGLEYLCWLQNLLRQNIAYTNGEFCPEVRSRGGVHNTFPHTPYPSNN
jgi:hypothetical protein